MKTLFPLASYLFSSFPDRTEMLILQLNKASLFATAAREPTCYPSAEFCL